MRFLSPFGGVVCVCVTSSHAAGLTALQESAADPEVSAWPGAAGKGRQRRGRQEDPGERGQPGQAGMQIQAELLQDGLCDQVRGLHVPEDRPAPGSSGESQYLESPHFYPSPARVRPIPRGVSLLLSFYENLLLDLRIVE